MIEKEKTGIAKAKFQLGVESFGTPSVLIAQLSSEKTVSSSDMRLELGKIEAQFESLKVDLMNLSSSSDLTAILEQYNNSVVTEVDKCKKIAFQYMKDLPVPTATAVPFTSDSGSVDGSSSRPYSTTKRETVMLPHFSGDEKSAYLKYPVWRKQWDEHIQEYEEKYRATMLLTHLDDKAQLQIVGLETDYEAATKQLDS